MSVIVWNFGANAQLEQGYGGVAFNWLSGEAVVAEETGTPSPDVFTAPRRGQTFIGVRGQTYIAPRRGQTFEGRTP